MTQNYHQEAATCQTEQGRPDRFPTVRPRFRLLLYALALANIAAPVAISSSVTITNLFFPQYAGTCCSGPFQAKSINNAGQIVGYQQTYNNPGGPDAILYSGGNAIDLGGGPADDGLYPVAINGNGMFAGSAFLGGTGAATSFLYSNGAITYLDNNPLLVSGNALGVSSNGTVLGYQFDPACRGQGPGCDFGSVLYFNGQITNISTLGGTYSNATAINGPGQVAGNFSTQGGANHLFLYSAGNLTDLGAVGAPGAYIQVTGLNNASQIVGNSSTQAFLYSSGQLVFLGSLSGGISTATGINSSAEVVGNSLTAGGVSDPFLYIAGSMTDLNSLLPANSGWDLQTASAINDLGQIVGLGIYNGQETSYLLDTSSITSVPEPFPATLLGVGILFLSGFARKGMRTSKVSVSSQPDIK